MIEKQLDRLERCLHIYSTLRCNHDAGILHFDFDNGVERCAVDVPRYFGNRTYLGFSESLRSSTESFTGFVGSMNVKTCIKVSLPP